MQYSERTIEIVAKYGNKSSEEIKKIRERLEETKADQKAIRAYKLKDKRVGVMTPGIQFSSVKNAAKHYGVHASTIYKWIKTKPLAFYFVTLEQLLNEKNK